MRDEKVSESDHWVARLKRAMMETWKLAVTPIPFSAVCLGPPQAGQSKRLLVEMRNDDHKKAQATFLLPALTLNARKLLQGIAGSKVWVSSPDKLVPTSLKATPFHRSNRT